ncbi:MAG: small multi-drug export protein [Candidatus Woesearchaeota archaeon]
MLEEIIILILMTWAPFLELRASIPYGIFVLGMNWILVFFVCVVANLLLVPLVWFFLHHILNLFLKIKSVDKVYKKMVIKTQKKVKPYIKKYGHIGLALFIGVPFPGSGVISGGLGAYLLGFEFKDYLIASIIGVLIAGIIITLISLFGNGIWSVFIKV